MANSSSFPLSVFPVDVLGIVSTVINLDGISQGESFSERLCTSSAGSLGRPKEPAELVHSLSEKLSPWEIPSRFITVETIPRTSTGKTDRGKLEELAKGHADG